MIHIVHYARQMVVNVCDEYARHATWTAQNSVAKRLKTKLLRLIIASVWHIYWLPSIGSVIDWLEVYRTTNQILWSKRRKIFPTHGTRCDCYSAVIRLPKYYLRKRDVTRYVVWHYMQDSILRSHRCKYLKQLIIYKERCTTVSSDSWEGGTI